MTLIDLVYVNHWTDNKTSTLHIPKCLINKSQPLHWEYAEDGAPKHVVVSDDVMDMQRVWKMLLMTDINYLDHWTDSKTSAIWIPRSLAVQKEHIHWHYGDEYDFDKMD